MNPFNGLTELTNAGFKHFETCHCGGILQHKFKPEGEKRTRLGYSKQFIIFPTIGRYKVFKYGRLTSQGAFNNIANELK